MEDTMRSKVSKATPIRWRRLALWGAAVAVTTVSLVGVPGPAMAVPSFEADSGDKCPMGRVTGVLDWRPGGGLVAKGVLVDQPLRTVPDPDCGEDGRISVATFTFVSELGATRTFVSVDNDTKEFIVADKLARRVTVQVCRLTGVIPGPPDYCGEAKEYRSPLQPA
jgi:hypothetical protein